MLIELREFFTLGRSDRAAAATGGAERAAERLARLVVQRARAAETLLVNGHLAEASRLADESLSLLRELTERYASVAALVGALPEAPGVNGDSAEPPVDDSVDEVSVREKISTVIALSRSVDGLARGREGRRDLRWQRIGAVVCFALLAAIVAVREARIVRFTVTASAFYGAQYDPKFVGDNFLGSNWLLPDSTPGWIDLAVDNRRVNEVELINVQNLVHYGTYNATIEFYAGPRLLRSVDVSLRPTVNTPNPTRVRSNVRERLTRVRIHIRTWHEFGGGLGEVRLR